MTNDAANTTHDKSIAAQPVAKSLLTWLDAGTGVTVANEAERDRVDWLRVLPFVLMHLVCLFAFVVGVSPVAIAAAITLYAVRMFAVTGFYHRYFSHRSFKTSRVGQLIFAVLGASAVQRGPIWWAAHHRHHHAHSDQNPDVHSPVQRGFLWSHMGWFLSRRHFTPDLSRVRDLLRFPELKLLDRFDILVPVALAVSMMLLGMALERWAPQLGTNGWQMLVWGFFISTVVCYHATYTINSLCHVFGRRRYDTDDDSRNNPWLALLTFGEGWHNNHHHYPVSVRQGFYWWEIDLTFYGLKLLQLFGVIWDLKPVPAEVRARTISRRIESSRLTVHGHREKT
jgi:stearoyl-CoA desaturase (delta-9 desaturase)